MACDAVLVRTGHYAHENIEFCPCGTLLRVAKLENEIPNADVAFAKNGWIPDLDLPGGFVATFRVDRKHFQYSRALHQIEQAHIPRSIVIIGRSRSDRKSTRLNSSH